MSTFIVSGPEWLEDSDMASCEQCGHWSSFDAGFEYNEEGYVQGWYEDEISCFGGARYDFWLYQDSNEDEDLDTSERFREFLTETDTEEAEQILDELERLGL